MVASKISSETSPDTLKAEALRVIGGTNENPTADERANFIVQRLEQFIRDGRTISEGMSLRKWQEMARVEIANAIIESQIDTQDDDVVTKRLLITFGCALTTIGFWGGLWSYGKVSYVIAAFLSGAAGLIMVGVALEWRVRKFWKRHKVTTRKHALRRCEDLTRRIKKMEKELEKEAKDTKKTLKRNRSDTTSDQNSSAHSGENSVKNSGGFSSLFSPARPRASSARP